MTITENLAIVLAQFNQDGRRQFLTLAESLIHKRKREKVDAWSVFEKHAGAWSGKFNRVDSDTQSVLRLLQH